MIMKALKTLLTSLGGKPASDVPEAVRQQASDLLDKMMDGSIANPKGFRAQRTKRIHARPVLPTAMERLATVAYPGESSLPTFERSKRGKRKESGRQKTIARQKAYAAELANYRGLPGVSKFAKKLPTPLWTLEKHLEGAAA